MLAGLASSLNWAVTSLLARSLLARFSPVGLSAVRSVAGGGLLVLSAIVAGEGFIMLQAPLWVVLALWSAIIMSMGVGDSAFFRSIEYLGLTRALALSLINPLLTTLTGVLLYREPMSPLRMLGILLVICGLGVIISGRDKEKPREARALRQGLWLVMLAAVAWAYSATILKPALLQLPILAGTALRIPMAGLVLWLTPLTRGTYRAIQTSSPGEQRRLAAVCLLNAIGSTLYTITIRSGGVAVGNVLSSTAPLFAIPLEMWVLKQHPSPHTVAGAVLTVVGIACMGF